MSNMPWVYDIVRNNQGKIVAINYHQHTTPENLECLSYISQELLKEGLSCELTGSKYDSLESARSAVWKYKDDFVDGLD